MSAPITKKANKRRPQGPSIHITLRVPRALAKRIKALAKRDRVTITEKIVPVLEGLYGDRRKLGSVKPTTSPDMPIGERRSDPALARPDDPYTIRDMP